MKDIVYVIEERLMHKKFYHIIGCTKTRKKAFKLMKEKHSFEIVCRRIRKFVFDEHIFGSSNMYKSIKEVK